MQSPEQVIAPLTAELDALELAIAEFAALTAAFIEAVRRMGGAI